MMANGPSIAALLFALAGPCFAQADTGSSPLCWRGRPAPHCGTFLITEFGYQKVLSTSYHHVVFSGGGGPSFVYLEPELENRVAWTVGPMFNKERGRAVGATASVAPLFPGTDASVEGRNRWWLPHETSFDVSVGGLLTEVGTSGLSSLRAEYGITGGVYLVNSDIINLSGHADLLLTRGKPRIGTSFGAGFGSYMTAIVSPIALLIVLIANGYAHEPT